jgi:hypothetical protein
MSNNGSTTMNWLLMELADNALCPPCCSCLFLQCSISSDFTTEHETIS